MPKNWFIFCYFGSVSVPSLPFWFHFSSSWFHVGFMLVPFWFHVVLCWFHFGSFWFHVGSMLVPFWFHFGSMLVSCWFYVGSILVSFWSQGPGTKILVPQKTERLRGGASQKSARGRRGLQAPRQEVWGAGSPPRTTGGQGAAAPQLKQF